LTRLLEGNLRFASGTPRIAPITPERRAELVHEGQHPFATVLGCVDSRAPLEDVFDVTVGDLLTIRTAGQALDGAALGSVEFGPVALGTELVAVVGHTQCGAVGAAIAPDPPGGALGELVAEISARLTDDERADYARAVEANLAASVAQLRALDSMVLPDGRSPVIVGMVDDLETGVVTVIDDGGLGISEIAG
jgi:carbonic anhydrase